MSPEKSKETSRDFLTLDEILDTAFAIDRIAIIESNEEEPACPFFETIGEYIVFYKRLVGRRIAVREFLAGKTDEQAVEDELRHLQNVIGLLVERSPESILTEERFGQVVPLSLQRTAWTQIFADFPGLLQWYGMFFRRSLAGLFITLVLVVPTTATLLEVFTAWESNNPLIWIGPFGVVALLAIILFQISHFRHRCYYHGSTLREIAEKIIAVKKQYEHYPIGSVDEVEPILLRTISETYEIPIDTLTLTTRLDTDLGFVH